MKIYLRFVSITFFLLLTTGKIFSQCNPAPVINFVNPSFEGTAQPHITPSPWTECMSGQTPDTQPGDWGVTLPATNGNTYLGLVAQPSAGWQEGASEQLSSPFIAGTTYTFTVDLANAQQSDASSGIVPGCAECQIWGGFGACDDNTGTGVLLWSSGNITPYDVWQTYNVTFTPTQNFTWVMIRINSLGCTDGPYILVDNISPIQPSNVNANFVLNQNVSCAGGTNGVATVHAIGLNTPFSYVWNTPNVLGDTVLNNVTAGTYTVIVTDANTCADTVSITITEPQPITLTPTIIPTTCFGFNTGSAYMSYAGGTAPYNFVWSNGPATQANPNLFAGTYGITATDANFCTATASITVTEPKAMLVTAVPVDAICGNNNGSATASVNGGAGPFTYLWDNGTPGAAISNLAAGTYTVTATSTPGCTATTSVTINSSGGPTLSPSSTDALCSNSDGSATVAITSGAGPYSYLWSNGDVTATSSNLIAGTYTVTVTGAGGCYTTASAVVNATGEPVLSPSVVDASCNSNDGSAAVAVTSGTGPYTYLWSNGDITATSSNLAAGTYTVTVTASGSCTATASAIVSAAGLPVLSPSVVNATCSTSNGSATATVISGTGPYTYLWSNGDVTQTSSNLIGGTYTVTVTGAANCTATVSAIVNSTDAPSLSSAATNAVCNNNNGSATVTVITGTGPYTYLWSNGDVTATASNLIGGTYTVTVTGSGCTATSSTIVNATGAPTLSSSVTTTLCNTNNGSASVSILTGTGPFTYLWNNGDITATSSNLSAGAYNVTVTGAGGCTATASVSVASSSNVVFSVAAVPTTCGLNNGSLSVTVTTGNSPYGYLWTGGNTSSAVSNLASGTYLVIVTDATGCSASASASVNPSTGISLAITSNNSVICSGDSAQICAPSGYAAYIWNTGETTSCITAQEPGNYYVTVTDQGNCRATSNHIPVTVRPRPVVSVTVHGDSIIVFTQQVVQWYFNGTAIQGATSQVYVATAPGNYTVAVMDTNGCGATSSGIVVETTTGIDNILANRVILYPNPLAEGGWHLSVSEEWIGSICELFDAEGRLVYKSSVLDTDSEIAYDPARGVYIMRIYTAGRSVAFKLVKL